MCCNIFSIFIVNYYYTICKQAIIKKTPHYKLDIDNIESIESIDWGYFIDIDI